MERTEREMRPKRGGRGGRKQLADNTSKQKRGTQRLSLAAQSSLNTKKIRGKKELQCISWDTGS